MPPSPKVSLVLLTWNEENNLRNCLRSLARQTFTDFEVILLDAASTDRTIEIAKEARADFPVPLRIEVANHRVPIGEARNRGVELAKADIVAFLSADAEASPRFLEAALQSLETADLVFGRQEHAPHRWTIGAAVRGLRYHFPDDPAGDPLVLASNVAAAFRRQVLETFPFEPWANAAEDLLLARRAKNAGFRPAYNPSMLVRHHDVASARQEMRKSLREGRGWGLFRAELGLFPAVLLWGGVLLAALLLAAFFPTWPALAFVALVLWAPALRRAARRARGMPARALLMGVLASPVFDLAFLVTYVAGLAGRTAPRQEQPPTNQETHA